MLDLLIFSGGLYGTRFIAYSMRRGQEKRGRLKVMPQQAATAAAGSAKVNGFPAPEPVVVDGGIPSAWVEPMRENRDE